MNQHRYFIVQINIRYTIEMKILIIKTIETEHLYSSPSLSLVLCDMTTPYVLQFLSYNLSRNNLRRRESIGEQQVS